MKTAATLAAMAFLAAGPAQAGSTTTPHAVVRADAAPALANAVVLIVRHGEKPDDGPGLAPKGQQRAEAYVHYFEHFEFHGKPVHIDRIITSADTKKSHRERLTMEPLAKALNLPIDTRFRNKDVDALAQSLATEPSGHVILICWHHGEIPALVQALGANSDVLFPSGAWPSDVFDRVIELPYDAHGRLIRSQIKIVHEHLLPGDK